MGGAAGDHEAFYCVVDLHAITVEQRPRELRAAHPAHGGAVARRGRRPRPSALFVQSHVPEHAQLAWVLECLTGFGEASRMTQFKDKSAKQGADRTSVGLFTYPVLQAADILLYQADQVPVGEDQRQHLELTRDLAQRFNSRFGDDVPRARAVHRPGPAKICDLQDADNEDEQVASAQAGCVDLLDDPRSIGEEDPLRRHRHRPRGPLRPGDQAGVSNLLDDLLAR